MKQTNKKIPNSGCPCGKNAGGIRKMQFATVHTVQAPTPITSQIFSGRDSSGLCDGMKHRHFTIASIPKMVHPPTQHPTSWGNQ